jgi:hypothetical protein
MLQFRLPQKVNRDEIRESEWIEANIAYVSLEIRGVRQKWKCRALLVVQSCGRPCCGKKITKSEKVRNFVLNLLPSDIFTNIAVVLYPSKQTPQEL